MESKQTHISRKDFVTDFIRLFKNEVNEVANKDYQDYLLPPGSSSLTNFLDKCNKCYDCISVCPHESLRVSHDLNSKANEYPVIIPEITPCYFCTDFPCIASCETGALNITNCDKPLGEIKIIEESCYAFHGNFCASCINSCPKTETAIYGDEHGHPIINDEECNSCGICISVCPSENPAIKITVERN